MTGMTTAVLGLFLTCVVLVVAAGAFMFISGWADEILEERWRKKNK